MIDATVSSRCDLIPKDDEKTIKSAGNTRLLKKARPTLVEQQQAVKTMSAPVQQANVQPFQMRYSQYLSAANNIFTPKSYNNPPKKPQKIKTKTPTELIVDQI